MWDEDSIDSKNISDNVVDFMVGKILKLPVKRQNVFKIATCIGSCFDDVIIPCIGFGIYHLGQNNAYDCTLEAIKVGYCCIDTAFIYRRETTESEVGCSIHDAINDKTLCHHLDIFVITKHCHKYHGYDTT
jgi:hypothetical protein